MQEISPSFAPIDRKATELSEADKEKIKGDPVAMYIHSIRTSSRLPEDLHESMILHAFDPAHSESVRGYLEWARSCEERDARDAEYRRRQSMFDRGVLASMTVATVAHTAFVLWMVFR